MKNVKESQQASQGVTIGTQGNQGGAVPEGAQAGGHQNKDKGSDRHIPNQDRSSSANQEKGNQDRNS
jgi:hypothetical protein